MTTGEFNRDKFKRFVHYVAWRAGKRPGFGATKLYKVLWFSESQQFVLKGKPIAGATYVKRQFGPFPRGIMDIRRELEQEGRLKIGKSPHHNRETTRFEALKTPDTHDFSEEELATINRWIETIAEDHTAASISEQSHDHAWEVAQLGEVLPFYARLAERIRPPTDEELERIRAKVPRSTLV